MSRSFTLAELRSRLEKMTDIENDTHISTTEKNEWLAAAASETWDEVINSGLAEQFVKRKTWTSTANQIEYVIDGTIVTDNDFYKVHGLFVDDGSGYKRPLERINPSETYGLTAPSQAVNLILYYIPAAPTFKSAGVFSDSATFEGYNGWEEHLLACAAIKVCLKKDMDARQFEAQRSKAAARITAMANTDWSGPSRVVRRYRTRTTDLGVPFTTSSACYALRGGKIELYAGGPLFGYPGIF